MANNQSYGNSGNLDDETINSYMSFTHTTDLVAARNALLRANGNLEVAVEAYLDSNNPPTSSLASGQSANQARAYEQLSLDDSAQSAQNSLNKSFDNSNRPRSQRSFDSSRPGRPANSKLMGFFIRLCIGPFRLIAIPISFLADLGLTLCGLLARLLRIRLPTMSFHWPRLSSLGWPGPSVRTDPRTAAERWVRELEEELHARSSYTTAHPGDPVIPSLPEFLLLGYDDAVEKAKDELKILMVVLVSEEHDDDYQFKRHTLMDEELLNLIRTSNILVWGGDVKERDAAFAAQVLDATTYPFVAFISLQARRPSSIATPITSSASRLSSNIMSVCTRLEGPPDEATSSRSICTTINTIVVPRTMGYLNRLKTEKARREADRRIREDQDRAYIEAGRLDRERVMKKKAELEAERNRLEQKQLKLIEREKLKKLQSEQLEQKRRWRYWARKELTPIEPTSAGVTIGFRLGNGRRVIRKFRADEPIKSLYLFVEIESSLPSSSNASSPEEEIDLPRPSPNYQHSYTFKLSTAMPRRILPLSDYPPSNDMTISQFGGLDGANVNVEGSFTDSSSSEEEDEEETES